ncbi:MAG: hypothetical protein Q4G18_12435 [Myroides sp.]|nr:hypothetical protein [Myroides sp.]
MHNGGFNNLENSYYCLLNDKKFVDEPLIFELKNINLSCLVYGFKYIYDYYKAYTLPILHIDEKDDYSIGSSFLYQGGILTAKHCIEGAKKIAIQGIDCEN